MTSVPDAIRGNRYDAGFVEYFARYNRLYVGDCL